MKILLMLVGVLVALVIIAASVVYFVGRAQPEHHTASIRFRLAQPPAAVWAVLTDYAAMPQWWPAVKGIRFETRPNGDVITLNQDSHGREIGFRTAEEKAPQRLVREITGENLPFGGTWTYELTPDAGGTTMTITEDGFVKPPFFRGMMKLIMKPDGTMRDFEKHFTARLARP